MSSVTQALSRSCAYLHLAVRTALQEGRIVRSRNRDGEYAIVVTDSPVFRKKFEHVDGIADSRADWTIAVPDFTLGNVAAADANGEPELSFWAPVIDRNGDRVGTIRVNAWPYGKTTTDQGPVKAEMVFFSELKVGDTFREAETDSAGRALLFRVTAAESAGRLLAEVVTTGEERVFDDVTDYLAFKTL
jgi:hypothetical protein